MFNPFKPPELIKAEVFTSLPTRFRNRSRTAWSDPNRQGAEVECFLECPSFDREGNLWIVDIPFGRIFRISPNKEWDLVVQYDGWPNGLKFHKDGRALELRDTFPHIIYDPTRHRSYWTPGSSTTRTRSSPS